MNEALEIYTPPEEGEEPPREVGVLTKADRNAIERMEVLMEAIDGLLPQLQEIGAKLTAAIEGYKGRLHKALPISGHCNKVAENSLAPRGGMRRMMIALAQRPSLNKRQLGIRAGLSSKSGTFGTYLGTLRANGWIDGDGDNMSLTKAGIKAVGKYDPIPSGKGLYDYWMGELGNSGAARMLATLFHAYPQTLSKENVGRIAGISHTSGTFGTYLGQLRSLELIEGSTELSASKEFFE
jgi:hypothetical protein